MNTRTTAWQVPLWAAVVAVAIAIGGTAVVGRSVWGDGQDSEVTAAKTAPTPAPVASTGTPVTPTATVDITYEDESRTLAKLRGGLSIDYFKQVLGVPWFVNASIDGVFTQYLFRGRDFWVQAVTKGAGDVQLMGITSCNSEFRPQLETGAGPKVVLNVTKLADLAGPRALHYFTGNTAPSYYYDEYYEGNPGDYKTFFIGVDDACPFQLPRDLVAIGQRLEAYDPADPAVAAFRAAAVVNTYAESGVFFDEDLLKAFQIGADRILTRTAPPFADASPTPMRSATP